jgi:hypothetical protein
VELGVVTLGEIVVGVAVLGEVVVGVDTLGEPVVVMLVSVLMMLVMLMAETLLPGLFRLVLRGTSVWWDHYFLAL